jgi:hypothetical protein
VAEPPWPPLPPRRATWLGRRPAAKRTEAEAHQLLQLHAQAAEVAEALALAQDCAALVRQWQPAPREPWLQRATASAGDAVRRFATGLSEDDEAVKAGVTRPWSAGPVAGHSTRLQMRKRQMLGRARLALLSRRFLRAPRARRARVPGPQERSDVHAPAVAAAARCQPEAVGVGGHARQAHGGASQQLVAVRHVQGRQGGGGMPAWEALTVEPCVSPQYRSTRDTRPLQTSPK